MVLESFLFFFFFFFALLIYTFIKVNFFFCDLSFAAFFFFFLDRQTTHVHFLRF